MTDHASKQDEQALPGIDFSTFILSMSHSAFVYLGEASTPEGDPASRNLVMARQTIDILALLADKTRGNLSGEEERLLEQVLYELRMRYVEASKESK